MELERALRSIVTLRAIVPEDAFTADVLGTERSGSGVVIREDGLVLTIGYLVTEAREVWLTGVDGRVTPAHVLAYDQETGFGLVQALGAFNLPALPLGVAASAQPGDQVVLAGGGAARFVRTTILSRQEFAGYWEYLLDEALFTAPALPLWGGAGLIGADGRLLGIGSLLVQRSVREDEVEDINMVVPIDLLPPILDDLLRYGQVRRPARPWLGLYGGEGEAGVVVGSVAEAGPAAVAGLRRGDVITGVRELAVDGLADFYRKLWASGPAGTEIPLEVVRGNRNLWLRVKSADRNGFLKKPSLQ